MEYEVVKDVMKVIIRPEDFREGEVYKIDSDYFLYLHHTSYFNSNNEFYYFLDFKESRIVNFTEINLKGKYIKRLKAKTVIWED